jgi:hypothetical protein
MPPNSARIHSSFFNGHALGITPLPGRSHYAHEEAGQAWLPTSPKEGDTDLGGGHHCASLGLHNDLIAIARAKGMAAARRRNHAGEPSSSGSASTVRATIMMAVSA